MNDMFEAPENWKLNDPVIGLQGFDDKDNEQYLSSDPLKYYLSPPRSNSPLSDGYYCSSIGNSSDFDVGSICSDVKTSLNGDSLDDDDSFCSFSFGKPSNDDELSLWSNDSLSVVSTNQTELSSDDSFSAWNYFDGPTMGKSSMIEQGYLNSPVSAPCVTTKPAEIILQHVIVPTPANLIKMTVVSPETSVHEVIKAAGIGEKYSSHFRSRQESSRMENFFIMNQQTTQMTVFPISSVITNSITMCSSNPSINEISGDNEDWGKEMPVLTPEEPLQPKQLNPSRSFELEQFYCSICRRELQSRHALMKHMKLHGAPRYKCNRCDRQFFDRTKLRRHQVVHSTERKLRCTGCQKSFPMEYNLKSHSKTRHFPLTCSDCKEKLIESPVYNTHLFPYRKATE